MKTKNNAQEKVNGQIKKMIFSGITVIISVVLISWTVGAQNFWEQVLTSQNAGNMVMTGTENPFEKSQANLMTSTFEMEETAPTINSFDANFISVGTELELQVEAYDASEYVEAEISKENENYLKTGSDATFEPIEAALEQQVEPYNANEFVEAELSAEAETQINSNSEFNFEAIGNELELQVVKYDAEDFVDPEFSNEAATNITNTTVNFDTIEAELEQQVEKYDASKFVEAELKTEETCFMNSNETIESDLAYQMDEIMKCSEYNAEIFVSADMAREIEKNKAQKEFLKRAENETAQEAVKEVEKYAMLLVSHINNGTK